MNGAAKPWEELFPPLDTRAVGESVALHLLRRHGSPLLLLPTSRSAARAALSLYPAQTWKARLARRTLLTMRRFGVSPGTSAVTLRLDREAPFVRFLAGSQPDDEPLTFAMLLGNPTVAGRRFVLLRFDANGLPMRVVKAGRGVAACELIQREARFLKSLPSKLLRAPVTCGEFAGEDITALAMEYAPGATPDANDTTTVPGILESWLKPDQTVRFEDLELWRRLFAAFQHDTVNPHFLDRLRAVSFHPTIHHGDFVPWNIRVDPASKRWTVLDWERGEAMGPPGWDWFHYVIQPATLVRRERPAKLLQRADRLLQSPAFRRYATQADIGPNADLLLLGYLLYCRDVVQQAQGTETIRALIQLVAEREGGNPQKQPRNVSS
jgi:hypothetical protein